MAQGKKKYGGSRRAIFIAALLLLALLPLAARRAGAVYFCPGGCAVTAAAQAILWSDYESAESANVSSLVTGLQDLEQWLDQTYYSKDIEPALQSMASQLTATMMQETLEIGSFFDAKNQLETQTLFQELAARAHKDYQPSFGMCVFGTNARSLGLADSNATLTETALSRQQQQRETEAGDVAGVQGPRTDRDSRLQIFANRYCDRFDNNPSGDDVMTGLGKICTTSPTPATMNKDIDYMRTLLLPRTLDIDFSGGKLTDDAQDVIAMSQNLYAHQLFSNVAPAMWAINANRPVYLDMRSIIAKRSVAEASFDAIAAMKSDGAAAIPGSGADNTADTVKYMGVLLQELGMPAPDIAQFLGSRPSYLAQLEMLAKKMYQRPEFYTELYESPANVARRGVAMQAIGNMLDRDIFKSHLRSEAILSLILEARLQPLQDAVGGRGGKLPVSAP